MGNNYEGKAEQPSSKARERILREAGQNLAELHMLGPLPAVGRIGVHEGRMTVLNTDEYSRYDDFRDWLLSNCEETLDVLTSGGWFPDLADDPTRFADLVPNIREYVQETIPGLPAPDPPTYCHRDYTDGRKVFSQYCRDRYGKTGEDLRPELYRYGNLLVDPETGATQAVLDWANLLAADPAYNLANAESLLLTPEDDGENRTRTLRQVFRAAYVDAHEDWSFDESTRERMRVYRLACRLDAMACLPLWYQDATPEERDDRAIEHRVFIDQYI